MALGEMLLDATIKAGKGGHWEGIHEWAHNLGCAIRHCGEHVVKKLLAESKQNRWLAAAFDQFARPYLADNLSKASEYAELSADPAQASKKAGRIAKMLKEAYPEAFAAPAETPGSSPAP